MKISLNWLGDYVDWIQKDPEEIARKITAHTAEVDEVEMQGAILAHCCVGRITNLQKHPDADRLSVCKVETDKGIKDIVCGGTNLKEGMNIAFAHVGAKVRSPDGTLFELSKAKIRGQLSEGMICAAEELELTARFAPLPEHGERPVIDFGDIDIKIGTSLQEYLGGGDTVLHIDNHAITHRADLFSHIGFARECVAIGIAKWKPFDFAQGKKDPVFPVPTFGKESLPFAMKVSKKELMPRYCSCTISIDSLGETPDWMRARLEATGWRCINLPIDITNYVAMEVGVPLHSFDADDIKGTVHMRAAVQGEKITTLDSSNLTLPDGALILEDDEGIFDLLGIMGGLRSSTKESTKNIFLHSCSLDPVSIRNAVIGTGHRTDAATVYEKGVPHYITEQGFYRAIQLFLDLVPGAKITSKLDSWGDNGKPKTISVSLPRVSQMLGVEIPPKTIQSSLEGLGFTVSLKKDVLEVQPPLWRLGDIAGAHDIIEEIGRMYGFDSIEPIMPSADTTPPERDTRTNVLRDTLKEDGYFELLPLSLVGPELLKKCNINVKTVEVGNPIGEELSLMQPSILPGLLEHAERAVRQTEDTLYTFHIAHVFSPEGEHTELGMFVAARKQTDIKEDSFLQAKMQISDALKAAGYKLTVSASKEVPSYAHPGRSADLSAGKEVVGHIFEVHPDVCKRFDLPARASAVLLNIDALLSTDAQETIFAPISQFPEVQYDETIELKKGSSAGSVLRAMQKASELLQTVEIADMYQSNLTLRFTYGSAERTLTEDEVKKEHEKVMNVVS